eukprot:SAG31_NODE_5110_length_2738_cov_1.601743_1_plen_479_part_10
MRHAELEEVLEEKGREQKTPKKSKKAEKQAEKRRKRQQGKRAGQFGENGNALERDHMTNPLASAGSFSGATFEMDIAKPDTDTPVQPMKTPVKEQQTLSSRSALDPTDLLQREAQYERVIKGQRQELDMLRAALWTKSKADKTSKKKRKTYEKLLQKVGEREDLHQSPNNLRTLRDMASRCIAHHGDVEYLWAFVFKMPADPEYEAEALRRHQNGDDDEDDEGENTGRWDDDRLVTEECWLLCEKLRQTDFCFKVIMPFHGQQILIAVGASFDVLVDEAHRTRVLMRLQETKGTLEFHKDLIRYYATNHGGLNEYENGKWLKRDPRMGQGDRHFKAVEDMSELEIQEMGALKNKIFTSGPAQQLILGRIRRSAHCDPDKMKVRKDDRSDKALDYIQKRAVAKKDVSGSFFREILDSNGGHRPRNNVVFPTARSGRPVVAIVAALVYLDPNFVLQATGLKSMRSIPDKNKITYEDAIEFC